MMPAHDPIRSAPGRTAPDIRRACAAALLRCLLVGAILASSACAAPQASAHARNTGSADDSGHLPGSAGNDNATGLHAPPWLERLRRIPEPDPRTDDPDAADGTTSRAERAHLPFERAVASLASRIETPEPTPADARRAGAEADRETARLYVRARRHLLDGNHDRAERTARRALQASDDAPALHALLGSALLERGENSAAIASMRRAIELGSRDPRILWRTAREAPSGTEPATRARWLAAAARSPGRSADPGLEHLILVDLGEALLEAGYLAAGIRALDLGFDLPGQFTVRTDYEDHLRELSSRAPTLLVEMGDAACRLGRYKQALATYERLTERATRDLPVAIDDRLVYALAGAGEAERAAARLAGRAARPDGLLDERLVLLIEHVSAGTGVGEHLLDTLDAEPPDAPASPAVDSWWQRLHVAAMPDRTAFMRLARLVRTNPDDLDAAITLMRRARRAAGPTGMLDAARELTTGHPETTRIAALAISRLQPDAASITERARAADDPALSHLATRLLLIDNRPAQAAAAFKRLDASDGPWRHALSAETNAAAGNWPAVEAAIARLRETRRPEDHPTGEATLALADTLLAAQRAEEAIELIRNALDTAGAPESASARVRALRLARRLVLAAERFGREDLVPEAHARVLEIDPFDERSLGWAITSAGSSEAIDREPIIARLRDRAPRSRLTRTLRVRQLASRGQWSAAEGEAATLAEEQPWDEATIDLLLSIWTRAEGADRQPRLERGLRWVENRLEDRPSSTTLARARVRILRQLDAADRADSFLQTFRDAHGKQHLASLHERVVRSMRGQTERAERMARQRLKNAPPGITSTIESAARLVRIGRVAEAAGRLERDLPESIILTTEQRERMAAMLDAAARRLENLDREDHETHRRAMLDLLDQIEALDLESPLRMARPRVILLAMANPPAAKEIQEAIASASTASPEQAAALRAAAAQALTRRDRAADALNLLASLIAGLDPEARTPQDVLAWMQLLAESGDAADARRLAETIRDPDRIARALREGFGPDADIPARTDRRRAELIYRVANLMSGRGREDAGTDTLRLALEIDPSHPWAANNLGYQMLERGRNLAEAERLIETAHEQLPDQSSIVDSLGWVRYRMGQLEDEIGPEGAVQRKGALTLLERAVEIDERNSPDLHDHLGDALWRTGKEEAAIDRWQRAESLYANQLERARGSGESAGARAMIDRLEPRLDRVRAKLEAARAGEPPPVAEVIGPPEN